MDKKQGFTLLEVIIAAGIFAIAVVTLLYTYVTVAKAEQNLEYRNQAVFIANSKLEEIRGYSFYSIYNDYNNVDFEPNYPSGFTGHIDVENVSSGLLKVNVSVSWSKGGISGGPVLLVTYIADR